MPRCKIKIRLNPPPSFTAHEELVKQVFQRAGLVAAEVLVTYDFGPGGEIDLPIETLDVATQQQLAVVAEELRTGEARAEFLTTQFYLTAAERDAAVDAPTPEAFDAPIQGRQA